MNPHLLAQLASTRADELRRSAELARARARGTDRPPMPTRASSTSTATAMAQLFAELCRRAARTAAVPARPQKGR